MADDDFSAFDKAEQQALDAEAVLEDTDDDDNVEFFPNPRWGSDIRGLGHDGQHCYYYSPFAGRVMAIPSANHKKMSLLALAPLDYWFKHFPTKNDCNWDLAISAMIARCWTAGPYNPDRVRGRGAWFDKGRWIYHAGDRLIVDGREMGLSEIPSTHIYEAGIPIEPPALKPLPSSEAKLVYEVAAEFRWAKKIHAWLLAGWTVMAPICGALTWRPHIWVSGGAGTGKTTVATMYIRPLLRQDASLFVQGDSTEAGLRQILRSDALPVLFDEAESNDKQAGARVQAILSLMRGSSSESGAKIYKGSAAGTAVAFNIRSSFALVSIGVGIKNFADETRISVLTLLPPVSETQEDRLANQQHWLKLQQDLARFQDHEFVDRLHRRTFSLIPVIRKNAVIFGQAVADHLGNQRLGDQLGTLIAAAFSLFSERVTTYEKALEFVRGHDWGEVVEGSLDSSEERALVHLLQSSIRVETTDGRYLERPVGELLRIVDRKQYDGTLQAETADRALRRNGLRVRDDFLYVANDALGVKNIFKNSTWETGWREQLRRLKFARAAGDPINFLPGEGSGIRKYRATELELQATLDYFNDFALMD